MSFPGRFAELIVPEQLHRISLSFLVDDLVVRRGGVAANICFGLSQLGQRPMLVAAVGHDFDDYRAWLERHHVDTSAVVVFPDKHTARFICTTDADGNQIASFYPGAMSDAHLVELRPVADRAGGLDLVVISPDDPAAMRRHSEEARALGIPFVADPSQQLARLEGDEAEALVDGAAYFIANDYERALLRRKTGWSDADVLARVGVAVTTHGAEGCVIERRGEADIRVAAVPPDGAAKDPTGVGDAFRGGFLAGIAWGLDLERAAQVGSLLATRCLETVGPQEYVVAADAFLAAFGAAFGAAAAGEVAPHLPAT